GALVLRKIVHEVRQQSAAIARCTERNDASDTTICARVGQPGIQRFLQILPASQVDAFKQAKRGSSQRLFAKLAKKGSDTCGRDRGSFYTHIAAELDGNTLDARPSGFEKALKGSRPIRRDAGSLNLRFLAQVLKVTSRC